MHNRMLFMHSEHCSGWAALSTLPIACVLRPGPNQVMGVLLQAVDMLILSAGLYIWRQLPLVGRLAAPVVGLALSNAAQIAQVQLQRLIFAT